MMSTSFASCGTAIEDDAVVKTPGVVAAFGTSANGGLAASYFFARVFCPESGLWSSPATCVIKAYKIRITIQYLQNVSDFDNGRHHDTVARNHVAGDVGMITLP